MVKPEELKFDEKGLIPAIVVDSATREVLTLAYMSQDIQSITADCDLDALVVEVTPQGPACHLGTHSCFTNPLVESENPPFSTDSLYALLQQRKVDLPEGSYTTYLFRKGLDKILKKIGEESTEVIIAGKAQDKGETIYEIADLMYHTLVLMAEAGITPEEIRREKTKFYGAGSGIVKNRILLQLTQEAFGIRLLEEESPEAAASGAAGYVRMMKK